jgi:hypothetical protein
MTFSDHPMADCRHHHPVIRAAVLVSLWMVVIMSGWPAAARNRGLAVFPVPAADLSGGSGQAAFEHVVVPAKRGHLPRPPVIESSLPLSIDPPVPESGNGGSALIDGVVPDGALFAQPAVFRAGMPWRRILEPSHSPTGPPSA